MPHFDLDLYLRQGDFTIDLTTRADSRSLALFGPSGSGKTSVVEIIAGLRVPERGTVAVGGHVLFSTECNIDVPPRHRRVGYVPQDVLLFPHLSVRANILYGRRGGIGMSFEELMELLALGELMGRRVQSLSGGERQRVAMARALMSSPDVLLLDEPMAAVDLPRRRRTLEILVQIRNRLSLALVYVAHAPEEIIAIADHVLVLDRGRLADAGPPATVLG